MPNTVLNPQSLISRGKWNDYRDEIWGDSYNWSWVRPWNQLKGILIHHSVTKHEATPQDLALLHKARGWAGIGYHFVIDKAGVVYYVGDISLARAHVANKNEAYLGVCMIGDFTKHLPSDDQIRSAHDIVKYFLFETPSIPTLNSWSQLGGHKDQQATACPGSSWPDDMKWRIENRKVYSAEPEPTPTPTPTPEPTPTPTPPVMTVITDPEQVIRLGKVGELEYGDMKLKDIRDGINLKDEQLKTALTENKTNEQKNAEALAALDVFSTNLKKLLS